MPDRMQKHSPFIPIRLSLKKGKKTQKKRTSPQNESLQVHLVKAPRVFIVPKCHTEPAIKRFWGEKRQEVIHRFDETKCR